MIAKARGVELDEEFLVSWGNLKDRYRITERGLELYSDGKWCRSSCIDEFIKGIGEVERLPFAPKMGEKYWTYYNSQEIHIETYCWSNNSFDKERKLFGILFRTEQEAKDYLPTWQKRLDGE